ncbi:MAG TPA: hypothetical protein PLW99_00985, partial [Candidatus Paceibacterota bacterium]|nr:hypothetical protein [Candidatus Paceibacterota bacterium]
MDDEKLLPTGEQSAPPSHFHVENKLNSSPGAELPKKDEPAPTITFPAESAKGNAAPKFVPPAPVPVTLPGVPSPAQQSWGAVISIIIIVLMVII